MAVRSRAAVPVHEVLAQALLLAGPEVNPGPSSPQAGEPAYRRGSLRGSGVRQPDGLLHPLAHTSFRNARFSPDATAPMPVPRHRLPGLSVFGGIVGQDFGHGLTQSLGRLWAGELAPDAPILFLPETAEVTGLPPYFVDLARGLGVRNALQLVTSVTQCDRLLVPEEICNLKFRPAATRYFVDWLARIRPAPTTLAGGQVYVSRSALSLGHGQYLQETVLEAALAASGYDIFHPEAHPIARQVAVYADARQLIFADGSAAHLWSLVAQPGQAVTVILRRPPDPHFLRWFRSLDGPRPAFVDCGIADFSRRGEGPHRRVALLDLAEVWTRLRDLGFHRDPTGIGTDRARLVAWVANLASGFAGPAPFPLDDRSSRILALCRQVTLRSGIDKAE